MKMLFSVLTKLSRCGSLLLLALTCNLVAQAQTTSPSYPIHIENIALDSTGKSYPVAITEKYCITGESIETERIHLRIGVFAGFFVVLDIFESTLLGTGFIPSLDLNEEIICVIALNNDSVFAPYTRIIGRIDEKKATIRLFLSTATKFDYLKKDDIKYLSLCKKGDTNSLRIFAFEESNTAQLFKALQEMCDANATQKPQKATTYSSPTSYLTVDNKTAVSTSFSYSGGSETFYVRTDGDSYAVEYLPSWCSVTNKTSTSFTLQCDQNTSTSSRTDWLRVKSGDKTVRIDVTQRANENLITGSIDQVWVEHNVMQGYGMFAQKGMRIHVKFTVNNMLNKTGNIAAYFNFQNGTKLMDYNFQYRTPDGQVTVQGTFTPNYTNCVYNDYQLFIPYTELHCGSGTSYLKFNVEICEKTTGSWRLIQSSSPVNFTYTGF